MADFTIEIAGHRAAVRSLFASTRDYCRNYLTEQPPETTIEINREDLVFEQEAAIQEAREEGIRIRIFPDPFLERAAIQRKLADYLFGHNILLFHGSTVALEGKAYLFTAKCGTGKSTHTRLWREVFGSRAVMVNDDKPFLAVSPEGVLACGSPWSGKHGLDTNITVPLAGICVLERGTGDRIFRADAAVLMPMLLHQGHCPPGQEEAYQKLVDTLTAAVPLWRMECTKNPSAAETAQNAMRNP